METAADRTVLEFTSSPFKKPGGEENLAACREAAESYGFEFGVQLHNTAYTAEIDKLGASGIRLSAHAPLDSEYAINLGAETFTSAWEIIEKNYRRFRKLGIRETVFHGFTMTDKPVPMFGQGVSYDECMQNIFREDLSLDGYSRMCCDFTETVEFKLRQLLVRERLAYVRQQFPDILWCVENDFPAYGSANMLADGMVFLDSPACLDCAHLWTSAFLFGRDFHAETRKILDSGLVKMVHVHASKYTAATPKAEWSDGHLPLNTPNAMELPRFVQACRAAGVRHYVLEIPGGDSDDVHAFARMWSGETGEA
ncbi:MAG: hypothetical protein PHV59_05365 [Victivallales bacterium]|nr:hypothetical protein [Victivallales bacterium]